MNSQLQIRNFGNIKHADITLGTYSVFVGDDDGGKTQVMQLIHAVYSFLSTKSGNLISLPAFFDTKTLLIDRIKIKYWHLIEDQFNQLLEEHKEAIIKKTFGQQLPIESLVIKLIPEIDPVFAVIPAENMIEAKERCAELNIHLDDLMSANLQERIQKHNLTFLCMYDDIYCFQNASSASKEEAISDCISKLLCNYIFGMNVEKAPYSMFFPANRSALQLLYTKELGSCTVPYADLYTMQEQAAVYALPAENLKLTSPEHEYLGMLQTYRTNSSQSERYQRCVTFLEERILQGKINIARDIEYQSLEKESIPLYLASPKLSELLCFYYFFTGNAGNARSLIIDGLESGLHPQIQYELVRLLHRIHNQGVHILISTNSEAIASMMNNLIYLSDQAIEHDVQEILSDCGFSSDDLLKAADVHMYEFVAQKEGVIVKEEPYHDGFGYNFHSFEKSLQKLLRQTKRIYQG